MHVLESYLPTDFLLLNLFAFRRFRIDVGLGVQELDDIRSSTFGRRDVGDEIEDAASLDRSECSALSQSGKLSDSGENEQKTLQKLSYHKSNKEIERSKLHGCNQS